MRRALQDLRVLAGDVSAEDTGLVDRGQSVLDDGAAHAGHQPRGVSVRRRLAGVRP